MRVFVSYRHTDVPDVAGRLHDHLVAAFGEDDVFLDVEAIEFGQDFRTVIRDRITSVDAVLVVIGPRFDAPRLADPTDFVRTELAEALDQGKLLVPVVVGDTAMLRPDDLPDAVEAFAYRHAAPLRPGADFRPDVTDLIESLRRAAGIGPARRTTAGSARDAVQAAEPVHRVIVCEGASAALALDVSADGSLLALGRGDGTVGLRSLPDGALVAALPGHRRPVTAVAFSPRGDVLASGGGDGTVRIWDVADRRVRAVAPLGQAVAAVAFSFDGHHLAVAGAGGLAIHDGSFDGDEGWAVVGRQGPASSVAFAPGHRWLAAGHRWGIATEGLSWPGTARFPGSLTDVRAVAVSPDSQLLAGGDADGTVQVWELEEGRRLRLILEDVIGRVVALAFSPDGSLLAGLGDRDDVVLWDPTNGAIVRELEAAAGRRALVFTPDGQQVVVAGDPDDAGAVLVDVWRL